MNEVLVLCYVCIFEAVVRQQKLACPRGMNQSGFLTVSIVICHFKLLFLFN